MHRLPWLSEQEAAEDKARYERELAAFKEAGGETQAEAVRRAKGLEPKGSTPNKAPRKPKGEGGGSSKPPAVREVMQQMKNLKESREEIDQLVAKKRQRLEKLAAKRAELDAKKAESGGKLEGSAAEEAATLRAQMDEYERGVNKELAELLEKVAVNKRENKLLIKQFDELERREEEKKAAACKKRKEPEKGAEGAVGPGGAGGDSEGAAKAAEAAAEKAKAEREAIERAARERAKLKMAQKEVAEREAAAEKAAKAKAAAEKAEKAAAAQERKRAAHAEEEVVDGKSKAVKRPKVEEAVEEEAPRPKPKPPPTAAAPAASSSSAPADPKLVERAVACVKRLDSAALEELSTALAELEAMPMTLALLAASGAGKAVNAIKKGETSLAPRAKVLVDRWKALAQTASS